MLLNMQAKFVGRIGGWYETAYGQQKLDEFFQKVTLNFSDLKNADLDIICQGAVFEYVSSTVNTFNIPAYVFSDFGLGIANRNFNYSAMIYPIPATVIQNDLNSNGIIEDNEIEYPDYQIYGRNMREDERKFIPDITQLESQLWFYYMSTRFILNGCEAIHFGQAAIMNVRDIGNQNWWSLLSKVRQYGVTRNRGVVIIDAHVGMDGGLYFDPNPNNPLPIIDRQLLFEFHSSSMGLDEYEQCSNGAESAIINENGIGVFYNRSKGGKNPQGWICTANPFLVELDNGGIDVSVGCNAANLQSSFTYGWELWMSIKYCRKTLKTLRASETIQSQHNPVVVNISFQISPKSIHGILGLVSH